MSFPARYDTPTRPCKRPYPGAYALKDESINLFAQCGSAGIYNCRNTRGSSAPSVHSEDRAWDAAFRQPGRGQRNPAGDHLANFLVARHQELGVQCVIWNRRIWSVPRGYWRTYSGTNPHLDHVHVELNWPAARGLVRSIVRAAFESWTGNRPPTAKPLPESPAPAPRRRYMEVDELERPARKRPEPVNGHECWDTEALAHGTSWNLDGAESVVHSVLCVRPARPTPEAKVTVYWPNAVAAVTVPWGGARWTAPADGAIAVVDENDVGLNVHVEQIILPR